MQRIYTGYYMAAVLLLLVVTANSASAHCEIPCGIYNDEMRFDMISEHITTIERSMRMIEELLKEEQTDHNQLVRWINNKEKHANEIQNIVSQYFMTQRIKPAGEDDDVAYKIYVMQITLLHRMLIHAMKAKQNIDLATMEDLRNILEEFRTLYFSGKKKR
jgi:nickel superoxide dismutase